ncbi:MAG: uracil-DNA glycosylase [Oscillospiraceae bacterium]|nr:uracil-DNA glycosylase [Oscillospiraceae bacterium]
MLRIGNDWDDILADVPQQEYYIKLREFIDGQYKKHTVYPREEDVFNFLRLTPYSRVKAVIIGQDPYHGPGQAHGLCFSIQGGNPIPPSLKNIFKEMQSDMGIIRTNGDLTGLAREGVLLINTVLTVRHHEPHSHKNKGWEIFTRTIIERLNDSKNPIVFLLWGKAAKLGADLITNPTHMVLTAPHPSPLSARQGFLGCRHFSKTNEFLMRNGVEGIEWR